MSERSETAVTLCVLSVLGAISLPAAARTIYIDSRASGANTGASWTDAYTDLQSALTAATYGDEIWVAAGTYRPSARTVPDDPRSATFTLRGSIALYGSFRGGESSPNERDVAGNPTNLSGDLAANDVSTGDKSDNTYHIVTYSEAYSGPAILDGFTVTGGQADSNLNDRSHGAGVWVDGAPIVIRNCTFKGNFALSSGAAVCRYFSDTFEVSNCVFEANEVNTRSASPGFSGAVESLGSNATLTQCIFRKNSSKSLGGTYVSVGAAITQFYGDISLSDCTFEENYTTGAGGAVYVGPDAAATITRCDFRRNVGDASAGALLVYTSSSVLVKDCLFVENACLGSGGDGGGAVLQENGVLTITGCTFSGNRSTRGGALRPQYTTVRAANCFFHSNSATAWGGAVYSRMSTVTMVNCVATDNHSNYSGGGIDNSDSRLTLVNCTIANNTATAAGGGLNAFDQSAGKTISVANSILWGNSDGNGTGENSQVWTGGGALTINRSCIQGWTGLLGGSGNIGLDPLLVAEDPWGHLQAASPCIDAGDSTLLPYDFADLDGDGNTSEPTPLDVDGRPRRVDDPYVADSGAGGAPVVDMGAHEYAEDCDANGLFDVCDLDCAAVGGICNVAGCGTAEDCNTNTIPDECEPNNDGDGLIDDCDPDDDNDTILDDGDASGTDGDHPCPGGQSTGCDDNCRLTSNVGQDDADGDLVGDACDACPQTIPGIAVDPQGCPPLVAPDLDRDGDVDQKDFGALQRCLSGASILQSNPTCAAARLDLDGDVDNNDMAVLLGCLSGPDVPVDPDCAD